MTPCRGSLEAAQASARFDRLLLYCFLLYCSQPKEKQLTLLAGQYPWPDPSTPLVLSDQITNYHPFQILSHVTPCHRSLEAALRPPWPSRVASRGVGGVSIVFFFSAPNQKESDQLTNYQPFGNLKQLSTVSDPDARDAVPRIAGGGARWRPPPPALRQPVLLLLLLMSIYSTNTSTYSTNLYQMLFCKNFYDPGV